MNDTARLLRHALAAIAYRAEYALRGAPASFFEFRAGTAKTPAELLNHMASAIEYGQAQLLGCEPVWPAVADAATERARLSAALEQLDRTVLDRADGAGLPWERLLQGPLADALTHVGQLALLRRLAGCPVERADFYAARFEPGRLRY